MIRETTSAAEFQKTGAVSGAEDLAALVRLMARQAAREHHRAAPELKDQER
jgi:hypothetical protein